MEGQQTIIHDEAQQQFRLKVEATFAKVDYKMKGEVMHLVYAEVPPELRGKKMGKQLAEKTFDYIEQHHIKAVADCSFLQSVAQGSEKWRKIIG